MSQDDGRQRVTAHIEVIDIDAGFFLFDDRAKASDMPLWFETREQVARYVSEHSTEAEFYAVGDWVKTALGKLGIDKPCLPCAKRQAKLNRMFARRPTEDPVKQSRKRARMARRRQRR